MTEARCPLVRAWVYSNKEAHTARHRRSMPCSLRLHAYSNHSLLWTRNVRNLFLSASSNNPFRTIKQQAISIGWCDLEKEVRKVYIEKVRHIIKKMRHIIKRARAHNQEDEAHNQEGEEHNQEGEAHNQEGEAHNQEGRGAHPMPHAVTHSGPFGQAPRQIQLLL